MSPYAVPKEMSGSGPLMETLPKNPKYSGFQKND
jgi:hypothetical protein